MNISNLFKIAINALRRNKFRAFLTMLGIIIGVASVIAMLAIGEGSKRSIQEQMSSMGTNLIQVMPASMERGGVQLGNTNSESLTLKDITAIQNSCPDVVAVSPELRASGQAVYGNKNWPTSMYGINDEYLNIKKYDLASGRMFTESEIKSMGKVCLVGHTVVKNLFGEDADPIGQTIRFKKVPIKIIGVLAPKGDNSFGRDQDDIIMAPYTTVQKRILAIDYIQGISMSAASEQKANAAIDEVEKALRKSHKITGKEQDDFRVFSQSELVSTFSSISNVLTALLGAIAGISLLVGGIGIMNIMYVSVTERTREIGLRMSIGGRGIDILMQFLIESVLLSVIGGILGIILGYLASNLVGSIMGWPVYVMSSSVILSFLVCSAIGIFFGWYPARKAAGLNPIDALRYE
ncbi:ABC transporter permease [Prolixibacter bellariivorans]|uniref:ABC transporter permease n=1 Tax=Prolixibacter bellariivorans TaxID=314319 RepID=A0A5M4B3J6_9BACT|nr:ABC transporter permease [Prolixibacter bellariivorans]GET34722.1 ABC transporter permease [Prolixibacter bellariivorans]